MAGVLRPRFVVIVQGRAAFAGRVAALRRALALGAACFVPVVAPPVFEALELAVLARVVGGAWLSKLRAMGTVGTSA